MRIPFERQLTKEEAFNLSRTAQVMVPLMNQTGYYARTAGNGYRALRLPYEIGSLGMVIVLPDEIDGLPQLMPRLDPNKLIANLRGRPALKLTALALPRFKAEFEADLTKAFKAAGVDKAFDPSQANFSGVTGGQASLYIGAIVHRAVIEVAEEATEAAAATAIEERPRSENRRPAPIPGLGDRRDPVSRPHRRSS
jgi:serpin B